MREFSDGLDREGMRLSVWSQHLRATLASPLWGGGIQALPPERALCSPHNLWVGLLHWTGLLGTACALLLAGLLAFPAVTYRFLTLVGVLLMVVSFVMPEGIQIGPSPLVQQRGAECLLFF